HSYGYTFSTQAGEWETITIPFDEMSADYRGRKVNVPNYAGEAVVELRILIGNKKEQTFELLVKNIGAK
ncbi:MAG: CIA30 family protein, partial [Bacteroidota bacterium]